MVKKLIEMRIIPIMIFVAMFKICNLKAQVIENPISDLIENFEIPFYKPELQYLEIIHCEKKNCAKLISDTIIVGYSSLGFLESVNFKEHKRGGLEFITINYKVDSLGVLQVERHFLETKDDKILTKEVKYSTSSSGEEVTKKSYNSNFDLTDVVVYTLKDHKLLLENRYYKDTLTKRIIYEYDEKGRFKRKVLQRINLSPLVHGNSKAIFDMKSDEQKEQFLKYRRERRKKEAEEIGKDQEIVKMEYWESEDTMFQLKKEYDKLVEKQWEYKSDSVICVNIKEYLSSVSYTGGVKSELNSLAKETTRVEYSTHVTEEVKYLHNNELKQITNRLINSGSTKETINYFSKSKCKEVKNEIVTDSKVDSRNKDWTEKKTYKNGEIVEQKWRNFKY